MQNGHLNIKDNTTGKFIRAKKLLIQIPIIKLNNGLIKTPSEGDFYSARLEYGEVIIGYTQLKQFITSQFLRISNFHKRMCGCEICISESMIQCELNPHRSRNMEKLISYSEISHSRRCGG